MNIESSKATAKSHLEAEGAVLTIAA